jgi:phosphate:Na+ symporter
LTTDLSRLADMLVISRDTAFRRGGLTRTRDLGRVGIGLGLMLVALGQLLTILTPYEHVPSLRLLLGMITTVPVIDVIVAAAFTWAAHSSVAAVLLIMSFAAHGVVPPEAAFALVLGANLGTALNPLFEAGSTGDPAARRLPIGNLLNRAVGCVLGLALLAVIGPWLLALEPNASRAVADFHSLFNLAMAVLFFPLLRPLARLLRRILPARAVPTDPSRPVYLDAAALEIPAVALAAAAREALRMADVVEAMLRAALEALDRGDRHRIAETKRLDDVVDRLNGAIKAYLTSLDHESLDAEDDRRLSEILAFITNLEHAGDIVERGVAASLAKRAKRNLAFSAEGTTEIRRMLRRLATNARTAAAVFMTGDVRAARIARREGGVPRARNPRHRSPFRPHPRRPGRERRDQCLAPRPAARPEADQRSYRRCCLSGARTARRIAAEPPQARNIGGLQKWPTQRRRDRPKILSLIKSKNWKPPLPMSATLERPARGRPG